MYTGSPGSAVLSTLMTRKTPGKKNKHAVFIQLGTGNGVFNGSEEA